MATELSRRGLPKTLAAALELLAVSGVMAACQMGIGARTLRRHKELRVVDRLPYSSSDVAETFRQYGLATPKTKENASLFVLGPVGLEIAKRRSENGIAPPAGYVNYLFERIMHDVVLSEFMLRLADLALLHDWNLSWGAEQRASLYQGDIQILKPDALIRLRKDEQELLFLVEYHNEDRSTRGAEKVNRYERAYISGLWQKAWNTDRFPPVLAFFRRPVVGRGYQEGVNEQDGGHVTYYGRALATVLKEIGVWFNFNTGQREHIWPWDTEGNDTNA